MRTYQFSLTLVAALVAGLALYAFASGGMAIDWFTIDGGGGTSSGGSFELSGTVGQPDAGVMTGGDFELAGGFWGGQGGTATGIEAPEATAPLAFRVLPAQPNPFNPSTHIRFDLPAEAPVKIEVYSVTGALVRVLVDEELAAGHHSVHWDGRDQRHAQAGSGVYIVKTRAGDDTDTQKITLLK